MDDKYLFHYTNLQSLALILRSKQIKFNSLMKVDDKEECLSQDITYGGKYCFVSSWTDDETESIPMWNLYSNLTGVRIKMQKNPFVKYIWDDPLCSSQKIESYLSLEQIYKNDFFPFFSNDNEILHRVKYSDDNEKLFPNLKYPVQNGYHIKYESIGKYKRKLWEFQREWRYILYLRPAKLSDYLISQEFGKTIYKKNILKNADLPITEIYLNIKQECIDNMEILCAPKMSMGDKILLESLLEKYCNSKTLKESTLKMR